MPLFLIKQLPMYVEMCPVQACLSDVDAAVASCAAIGYPCMLKASWGGGGKGIRKVCYALLICMYAF